MRNCLVLMAMGATIGLSAPAAAQNVSGIFGPTVDPEDFSAEWRGAWDPDADRFATRLHVQKAVSDSLRVRGIIFARERGDGFETNAVAAELLWQVTPDEAPVDFGIRFDVRHGWNGTSDRARVNLIADYDLAEDWSVRGILLTERQFGEDDGRLRFETRGRIEHDISDGLDLSLQFFGDWGTLDEAGDRELQLGPMLEFNVGRFGVGAGYLAGIDNAPDHNFRLFIDTSFR